MVRIENDCVCCTQGCIDCGAKHTPHFYCDYCKEEEDKLYRYEGDEICESCLLKQFEEVEVDD